MLGAVGGGRLRCLIGGRRSDGDSRVSADGI